MRFRKIEIPSYGPFTGFEEKLPSENSDLHLFYGANEAGKSSLLRSLRDFLFGIPTRSTENFLHDYRDMRIAAELENKTGTTATFQRKKGRSATLLDADGKPVPDSALMEFLGGVDAPYFDSMFGLDFEKLREGAEELLRGEGRLGEALFSASLGGTPVDKVLKSLETEAAALFKGRSQASIRTAKRQLDESQKAARDAITRPESWEDIENSLAEKNASHLTLETTLHDLSARREWLERCRDILPVVGSHADQLRLLSELHETPDLDSDFPERIREARRASQAAAEAIAPLEKQIATLTEQASAISPDTKILSKKSTITALAADAGAYREQKKNHTKTTSEATILAANITRQATELGLPSDLSKLEAQRISKIHLLETKQAAESLTTAHSEKTQAELSIKSLEKEIASLQARRTPVDPTVIVALETALAETKGAGEIASSLPARIEKNAALLTEATALHQRLAGAPADLQTTAALSPPLKSSLEKFREAFSEAAREKKSAQAELTTASKELATLNSEIAALTATGDIPSPEKLTAARAHRETGWQAVLKAWKNGETSQNFSTVKPLETAYPEAVTAADAIADSLRDHAETVARIEEKKARLLPAEARVTLAEKHLDGLAEKSATLTSDWNALLQSANLPKLTPPEAIEWREIWENFSRTYTQWQTDSKKIVEDQSRTEQAATLLRTALSSEITALETLLETAGKRIATHNQTVGAEKSIADQISSKTQELDQRKSTLPSLTEALSTAEKAWQACQKKFSFPASLSPENTLELLHARSELFTTLDRHQQLIEETTALAETTSEYESKVAELASTLALKSTNTATDISTLTENLITAATDQSALENLKSTLADRETALTTARELATRSRKTLDELLSTANLPDEAELEPFLHRLTEKSSFTAELRTLRQAIASAARGAEVEDFIAKVREENPDELQAAIAETTSKSQRTSEELKTLNNSIRDLNQQRQLLENASDDAAAHTQQAELATGRILADGERFVRLQLAISLLKSRIETFREQNQGPSWKKPGTGFPRSQEEPFPASPPASIPATPPSSPPFAPAAENPSPSAA